MNWNGFPKASQSTPLVLSGYRHNFTDEYILYAELSLALTIILASTSQAKQCVFHELYHLRHLNLL